MDETPVRRELELMENKAIEFERFKKSFFLNRSHSVSAGQIPQSRPKVKPPGRMSFEINANEESSQRSEKSEKISPLDKFVPKLGTNNDSMFSLSIFNKKSLIQRKGRDSVLSVSLSSSTDNQILADHQYLDKRSRSNSTPHSFKLGNSLSTKSSRSFSNPFKLKKRNSSRSSFASETSFTSNTSTSTTTATSISTSSIPATSLASTENIPTVKDTITSSAASTSTLKQHYTSLNSNFNKLGISISTDKSSKKLQDFQSSADIADEYFLRNPCSPQEMEMMSPETLHSEHFPAGTFECSKIHSNNLFLEDILREHSYGWELKDGVLVSTAAKKSQTESEVDGEDQEQLAGLIAEDVLNRISQ